MGSSLSCLCDSKASKKHVFVIKHNGKVMKVKAGTRVNEIVAANPCHTVLCRGPGHSVSALPDCFELDGHELYFLVPEGQDFCRHTINSALVKLEQSRNCGGAKSKRSDQALSSGNSNNTRGQLLVLNKKYQWRPALHTISETTSSLEKSS